MGELQWICRRLSLQLSILVISCSSLSQSSPGAITLINPHESPVSVHPLWVQYSCSDSAMVHLQVLVSFDTGTTSVIFQRRWECSPGAHRTHVVKMHLPDWLVYQPDWRVPMSDWVLSCFVRVWMSSSVSSEPSQESLASVVETFTVLSPLSRMFKEHLLCPSWETEMLWKARRWKSECPVENEVASLLSSLYGSTGENFGITRTLHPYTNRFLEGQRLKAITYPWCAFSIWVLLDKQCKEHLCGILYHIDLKENYVSPSLFLTRTGHIHVQLELENGSPSAFLSSFTLPLHQWCLLNLELTGRMGKITVACIAGHEQPVIDSSEYTFSTTVRMDDTDGYFVVGGGKFIRGIEGFYGPVTYYRTRTPSFNMSELQLPQTVRMVNISGWLQSCQQFQAELERKISAYSCEIAAKTQGERCVDVYTELALKTNPASSRTQCSSDEALHSPQRRPVARLVEKIFNKYGSVSPAAVGRALYAAVLRTMEREESVKTISRLMPSLLQAGCLGDNRALHLASVLYSGGLGVKKQPYKAWLLSVLGAQKDWRLALLRLGHLHRVGDQGVEADPDLSYAYYSNIARQTSADRLNPSSQQMFVESIHLNDEEILKAQTNQDDDIFQWLKLQARNGVADAERAVARMLFWGQQGVSPDIQTAVRHYERGATRLQDPVSMYDYAIILLTGRGVPQDVPKAVTFLKKAQEQGFAPAITALGWYYEQFEKNYERAVELWEQADQLENPDAAMNLGVLHLQGLYPGQPPDKVKAYKYFLKSAQRGHINGGIELAEIWSRGIPGYVVRHPSDAVLWVKWASEQNGYLGTALRKGLNAYLKGNWFMALINYLICAECGFEAAQFNIAFLCEHSPHGSLNPAFMTQCMLRYYNLSIQSQDPSPYALVKMGDLFYEEHTRGKRDLSDVAEMYKKAALKNDPQGWYSLGLLVQEGHRLPAMVLSELKLLQHYFSDRYTLLTSLYHRCRDSNSDESYLPCTLALLASHLDSIQTLGPATVKLLSAVAVAVATLSFFKLVPAILRQRSVSSQQSSALSESSEAPEQDETPVV
ncbi:protein sel-1 homolog 3 [Pangasianodon hypophthalmus]|uniref:protein sel-1 homolog 3 n=1 Tax=Pangasianodon hypophthalmus TaxID=310915 RepID=UPI002307E036|nr:protein sel-1 homolog 3 [Pangasianodon hypophthalmus]